MMSKFMRNHVHRFVKNKRNIGFVVSGTIVAIISGAIIDAKTSHPPYKVLYQNLTKEDFEDIDDWLKESKLPYIANSKNNSILVPEDKLILVEFDLLSVDLPTGGIYSVCSFDLHKHPMIPELEKSIRRFPGIGSVYIRIEGYEKSHFNTEQMVKPTAKITLRLHKNYHLSKAELDGIVHLVSSSVDRLSPENITVVDFRGNKFQCAD